MYIMKYKHDFRFNNYDWNNIPGRKVYHAFVKNLYPSGAICGQTSKYDKHQLFSVEFTDNKCEQCIIRIITDIGASCSFKVKVKRRKLWKEWLNIL